MIKRLDYERNPAFCAATMFSIAHKLDEVIDKVNELSDGCLPELSYSKDTVQGYGIENINPKMAEDNRKLMDEAKKKIAEWLANAEEDEIIKHLSKFHPESLRRLRDKINVVLERIH